MTILTSGSNLDLSFIISIGFINGSFDFAGVGVNSRFDILLFNS